MHVAHKGNALTTLLDTIVMPKGAFESIRVAPTWALALAMAIVIGAVSAYVIIPAVQHASAGSLAHKIATDPVLMQMTPEQQQHLLAMEQKSTENSWVFVVMNVPLGALFAAAILLIFDKLGDGAGTFAKYWSAACNIAVVVAIGSAVKAVIVLLRGTDSFQITQDLQHLVPSLIMLAPGASAKVGVFLSAITPFTLWACALNALALRVIGNTRPVLAWAGAAVLLLLPAVLASLATR